jgi:uncharacterized protein DUF4384
VCVVIALAALLAPGVSSARGLSVEVWTDRGNEAVYQPGERMQVRMRSSEDSHVLVYEIDAEGYVRLLYPEGNGSGFVEARETYQLPPENSGVELVVQEPVGECYLVAIASVAPLDSLPWYLRPYNAQAEAVGYVGAPDEEQGVTAEGRIVGDPFVAMERIRRRVLEDATDGESFATAYTTYYVHQQVKYPRYVCYDCHRPGQWAWWDGFDPYYAQCSVFDLRVNWSWYWGPSYWYGYVPYFVYVYRPTCPPRYHSYYDRGGWYSSWDGWNRWCNLWGNGTLRRYKSAPPPGYTPPPKMIGGGRWRAGDAVPPGFLASTVRRGRSPSAFMPVGRVRGPDPSSRDESGNPVMRQPRGASGPWGTSGREQRPAPVMRPRDDSSPTTTPPREERPAPAVQSPPVERPRPGYGQSDRPRDSGGAERPRDTGRVERPPDAGRQERPRDSGRTDAPRPVPGARGARGGR